MEKYGKMAVLSGGYGHVGEILHGRLWVYRDKTLYNLEVKNVLKITSKSLYLHWAKSWTLPG